MVSLHIVSYKRVRIHNHVEMGSLIQRTLMFLQHCLHPGGNIGKAYLFLSRKMVDYIVSSTRRNIVLNQKQKGKMYVCPGKLCGRALCGTALFVLKCTHVQVATPCLPRGGDIATNGAETNDWGPKNSYPSYI